MSAARLTESQERILRSLHTSGDFPDVRGRAAHGGMEASRIALVRKGLIEFDRDLHQWRPTDAGREAIGVEPGPKAPRPGLT